MLLNDYFLFVFLIVFICLQPLDRDPPNGYEIWQVLVAANDEDGGPTSLRGSTEVVISLIDINDNAPQLNMVCYTSN